MSEVRIIDGRLTIGIPPMVKRSALPGFKISRAVGVGDWLFTGGQMDYGEDAKVCNPHDLVAQTVSSMRSVYELMAKTGRSLSQLAQVQVFYLGGSVREERALRQMIVDEFPECRDVLLVMTRVASFATIGSEVEIDAIAVSGPASRSLNHAGDVRAVRRGDWVFASSRVAADADDTVAELRDALGDLGGGLADVCRLYAYYPADLGEVGLLAIERKLGDAFRDIRPAFHAALLPRSSKTDFAVELEVVANADPAAEKLRLGRATPRASSPDWPFAQVVRCGEVVFCSGQFPVDAAGAVSASSDSAEQARVIMRRLGEALGEAGARLADVAKLKTYYVGGWDRANWERNLTARMESLSDPGPASAGLDGLLPVMAGAQLSVDGIAVLTSG